MTKENKEKLKTWRIQKMEECKYFPKYFYYFSLTDNLESIIDFGILPKNEIENKKIATKSFANPGVQHWRKITNCPISGGKNKKIHDLVPVYLNPRTPTISAVRNLQNQMFFCLINSKKLISDTEVDFAFTDGNASSQTTQFYWNLNNLKKLNWRIINGLHWNDEKDGKRIRNCEFLIFPKIKVDYIDIITCFDTSALLKITKIIKSKNLKIKTNIVDFFWT